MATQKNLGKDHLNKYGNVKEPFVFKATEELVKQKQVNAQAYASPYNVQRKSKRSSRVESAKGFGPVGFVLPILVLCAVLVGGWMLIGSGDKTVSASPMAELAEDLEVTGSENTDPEPARNPAILTVADKQADEVKKPVEEEKENEAKKVAEKVEKKEEPVVKQSPAVELKEEQSAPATTKKIEKESAVRAVYYWVVYSAESALDADRKIEEMASQGAEVMPLSAKIVEGERIRLVWKRKFDTFESALAEKDRLPKVFGPDAWILKVN